MYVCIYNTFTQNVLGLTNNKTVIFRQYSTLFINIVSF